MTGIDAAPWRTASYSIDNNGCVEAAPLATKTGVRDTKNRACGHLEIGPAAWTALVRGLRN
ncbi:DUF397 domain-containing protein [Embleya sp. NPDC005971]|uniref:DUF397 domain-containing protein n=1 Tax=Embleya sp. NPDC005971 TaxID=3156724 RepID=UPI00340E1FE7